MARQLERVSSKKNRSHTLTEWCHLRKYSYHYQPDMYWSLGINVGWIGGHLANLNRHGWKISRVAKLFEDSETIQLKSIKCAGGFWEILPWLQKIVTLLAH